MKQTLDNIELAPMCEIDKYGEVIKKSSQNIQTEILKKKAGEPFYENIEFLGMEDKNDLNEETYIEKIIRDESPAGSYFFGFYDLTLESSNISIEEKNKDEKTQNTGIFSKENASYFIHILFNSVLMIFVVRSHLKKETQILYGEKMIYILVITWLNLFILPLTDILMRAYRKNKYDYFEMAIFFAVIEFTIIYLFSGAYYLICVMH